MFWWVVQSTRGQTGANWSNCEICLNSMRKPGNDGVSKVDIFGHKGIKRLERRRCRGLSRTMTAGGIRSRSHLHRRRGRVSRRSPDPTRSGATITTRERPTFLRAQPQAPVQPHPEASVRPEKSDRRLQPQQHAGAVSAAPASQALPTTDATAEEY